MFVDLTFEVNHDIYDQVLFARNEIISPIQVALHDQYFGGEIDGLLVGTIIAPPTIEKFYRVRPARCKRDYKLKPRNREEMFFRKFVVGDIAVNLSEAKALSKFEFAMLLQSRLANFVRTEMTRYRHFDAEACATAISGVASMQRSGIEGL